MRYLFVFILFVLILVRCTEEKPSVFRKISGLTQGTTYHITYEDLADQDFKPTVDSLLQIIDLTFSAYIPNSLISRINRNDTSVVLNDLFIELYDKSVEIHKQTNGAFDLTVGPLVNAWGFGPESRIKMTPARVDSLLQFVGMDKVRLENRKIIKSNPGIKLDVNSIAQGYSVDLLFRYLESHGIKNFMVEIGGEVRSKGKNSLGGRWRIGLDRPAEGASIPGQSLQSIILIDNRAITTSGNYRKYFEENGKKYSHIIDPHTGYSFKNSLLSVTVIAADALTADGYDTPLMVLGLEGARKVLKQHPELAAYMIYTDENGVYQVEYSKGIEFDKEN
jgi:thiamine biosynthesis lipoprotein